MKDLDVYKKLISMTKEKLLELYKDKNNFELVQADNQKDITKPTFLIDFRPLKTSMIEKFGRSQITNVTITYTDKINDKIKRLEIMDIFKELYIDHFIVNDSCINVFDLSFNENGNNDISSTNNFLSCNFTLKYDYGIEDKTKYDKLSTLDVDINLI